MLEQISNATAACTFAVLMYWLVLYFAFARCQIGKLRELQALAMKGRPPEWFADCARLIRDNRTELAELRLVREIDCLRPSTTWERLPLVSTDLGMLYTVIGTSIAFLRISEMNDPIQLLGSLQLALVTTVCGLIIKILAVNLVIHPLDRVCEETVHTLWEQLCEQVGVGS